MPGGSEGRMMGALKPCFSCETDMSHFVPVLHLMTDALRRHLGPVEGPAPDPLDHPALRGMSLRDLADLPLPRPQASAAEGGDVGPAARP